MSGTSAKSRKGLVVFLGADELRQLCDAWPVAMNLAVCLMEDGDCQMVVFHDGEGARIVPRVKRVFGPDISEIAAFPEVAGFAVRKLLFSEEKQIHSLVRNTPELVEEARDYSVNYSFAVEEGLDPVRFFHMARGQALRDPRDTPVVSTHEGATGGFPKTVKHPRKPGIPTQIIERHLPEQLPKFLRKGASIDAGSSLQTQKVQRARGDDRKVCVIQGGEDGRVSIDLPGCLGEEVNLNDAGHIFVRDDRGAIALPKTLIEFTKGSFPKRFLLNAGHQSRAIHELLMENVGLAQLTFSKDFILLDFNLGEPQRRGRGKDSLNPCQVDLQTKGVSPKWRFWASAGTALAILGIILQTFLMPSFAQPQHNSIDWKRFQSIQPER